MRSKYFIIHTVVVFVFILRNIFVWMCARDPSLYRVCTVVHVWVYGFFLYIIILPEFTIRASFIYSTCTVDEDIVYAFFFCFSCVCTLLLIHTFSFFVIMAVHCATSFSLFHFDSFSLSFLHLCWILRRFCCFASIVHECLSSSLRALSLSLSLLFVYLLLLACLHVFPSLYRSLRVLNVFCLF